VLLLLREDDLAVAHDVELTFLALGDRRLDPVAGELGGETRRPFVVARSDGAVEDLDGHGAESIGSAPDPR
jgi:hypothetical protein